MLTHELISSKILIALRGIIAHRLNKIGVSQRKISRYLEVTQPMISKILRKPLDNYYQELDKLKIPREVVNHYVDILVSIITEDDYERFISTSYSVINQLALGSLCNTRRHLSKICISGEFREPELEHYKSILLKLLNIKGLDKLVPEVGSNLVYAPSKPSNISGIIGLTGRIVKTAYGVTYYGEPIYGGSRHVARILLIAIQANPNFKYCINIKFNKHIRNILSSLNIDYVETGPHLDEEDFWANIE
ncbi:MAG: thiamine-phosphate synthase family protein, partial [Desulfurococcaceae archaeon]